MILRLFLMMLFVIPTAHAAQSDWGAADHIRARLLASENNLGIELRLDEGWHTYWRFAGDSGLPPTFDWGASENITVQDIQFPFPKRYDEQGLQTFGYSDSVMFLSGFEKDDPSAPATLALTLQLLICKDICIPQAMDVRLELPAQTLPATDQARFLSIAERKIPAIGETPRLKMDTVVAGPEALVVSAYSERGFNGADLFVENEEVFMTAQPQIETDPNDSRRAMIKVKPFEEGSVTELLAGKTLTLTFVAGGQAIEKEVSF